MYRDRVSFYASTAQGEAMTNRNDDGDRDGDGARVGADLFRLALQAEWLALMIERDLERESRTPAGRAQPLHGVQTPMQTKTKKRQPVARVPLSLALAA